MITQEQTIKILFDELEAKCRETAELLAALKASGLAQRQKDNLIGELSVCISSFHVKTELLEKDLDALDELEF